MEPKKHALTATCETHGEVHPACPRCVGRLGGQARRGRGWHQRLDWAEKALDLAQLAAIEKRLLANILEDSESE